MDNACIMSKVDHTLLKPVAKWGEIADVCADALKFGAATVCIPPSFVGRVKREFPGLTVCTVIGFPLGYNTAEVKRYELERADFDGADEFDMVINLDDLSKVCDEISLLKKAAGGKVLKVIVETCYLTREEKIAMCAAVTQAGADYIKTSTGFGTGGATMEDILLFKEFVGEGVKIKASGGIRTRDDMVAFINAGCERLGTSSAVKILFEGNDGKGY